MTDHRAVTRVHTDTGSHIEPALNDDWPLLQKLQWHAAVVAHDTGLNVRVDQPDDSSLFSIQIGNTSSGMHDFSDAWTYLNGVTAGARAVA